MAVTRDVAIVFGQSFGEKMSALIVGDEVEVVSLRRVDCGAQRCFSRICNGSRRQAGMLVGVVQRIDVQVGGTEVFRVMAFEFQRVLHGGIALQGQALAQTIAENSSDHRTLVRLGSFAFNQRGQGDHLEERQAQRKSFRSGRIERFQLRPKILDHSFCNQFAGGMAGKLVSGGEKKSFETGSVWRQVRNESSIFCRFQKAVAGANSLAIELCGHLKHVPAFGNGHSADVDAAPGDLPEDFTRVQRTIEIIFTGLQRFSNMPHAKEFEGKLAANYIIPSENAGHSQPGSAVGYVDKHSFRAMTAIRAADLRIEPAGSGAEGSDQKKSDEAESTHRV